MVDALNLEEAEAWALKLSRPPKHAFKNSFRAIATLIRTGRARGGRHHITISLKEAFKTHRSMGNRRMDPLADKRNKFRHKPLKRSKSNSAFTGSKRATRRDKKGRFLKGSHTRRRARGRAKKVDVLFKIMTRKKFVHKGGKHVEVIVGGDAPFLVFGGSGLLPSVHQRGLRRMIDTPKGKRNVKIPARRFLEVTEELADQAENIMTEDYMKLIDKGFF